MTVIVNVIDIVTVIVVVIVIVKVIVTVTFTFTVKCLVIVCINGINGQMYVCCSNIMLSLTCLSLLL